MRDYQFAACLTSFNSISPTSHHNSYFPPSSANLHQYSSIVNSFDRSLMASAPPPPPPHAGSTARPPPPPLPRGGRGGLLVWLGLGAVAAGTYSPIPLPSSSYLCPFSRH